MLRTALLTALLGLAVAAPAASAALAPPPTVLDFEALPTGLLDDGAYAGAGVTFAAPFRGGEGFCGTGGSARAAAPLDCATVTSPGHDSERSVVVNGAASLDVSFATPQASVSMWVSAAVFSNVTVEAWSGAPGSSTLIERLAPITGSTPYGRAAVLQSALGRADIGSVRVFSDGSAMSIDDITFSPVAQPDTEILSGPAPVVRDTGAGFVFVGNQADTRFDCSLDGAIAVPCRAPYSLSGLAAGPHTLTVGMRDRFGTPDPTPAVWAWTVDLSPLPVPGPPAADGDGDGVPDARDNCPAAANASQADADGDGVGDACETAPPGNVLPIAGERIVATVLSGDVFVKLPASTSRSFKQAQLPGFVPLKGQAALPIGTVVDTRKGRMSMASAIDGRKIGSVSQTQSAVVSAGIFEIRQRKAAPGSRTKISTDMVLQSAPGAESSCVSTSSDGPIKGRGRNTVRGLTATTPAKGFFRIVGAAGISIATAATTWATKDRCDGTRTDVGKGKVSVLDRESGKTITVGAGRSYLVKAKLFSAKQGRGS